MQTSYYDLAYGHAMEKADLEVLVRKLAKCVKRGGPSNLVTRSVAEAVLGSHADLFLEVMGKS